MVNLYGHDIFVEALATVCQIVHGIAIATAAKHPTQFTDGITQSNSQYETQILGVDVEIKQNIEIFKENPNILNSLMSAQEHKQLILFFPNSIAFI